MKKFTSTKQQLGEIGEDIATQFLLDKNFRIIERNYTKKIGEIDIIASKDGMYRFIEVKTLKNTSSEYQPEYNVSVQKLKRFIRTIQYYIHEHRLNTYWQIDIIAVRYNQETQQAQIRHSENIIVE